MYAHIQSQRNGGEAMKKVDLEYEAQLAYEEAVEKAWKIYQAATVSPRETFLAAVKEDFEIYNRAVDEAVKAYSKSVVDKCCVVR